MHLYHIALPGSARTRDTSVLSGMLLIGLLFLLVAANGAVTRRREGFAREFVSAQALWRS
jgi:hypothetical protein